MASNAMATVYRLPISGDCWICRDFHCPRYFWQVLNIIVYLESFKYMFLPAVLLVLEETAPVWKVCGSGLHVFRNGTRTTEHADDRDPIYGAGMVTSTACLRNFTITHRFPVAATSRTPPWAAYTFGSLFDDWIFDR